MSQTVTTLLLGCFNSRTPGGVRRMRACRSDPRALFQFTHPGRGATQIDITIRPRRRVSIHAPREGCDCISICKVFLYLGFNSRTPGGVRQKVFVPYVNYYEVFQFTHPGRGATRRRIPPLLRASGFNSRTPGGVRLPLQPIPSACLSVSIHAPREGCDRALFGGLSG